MRTIAQWRELAGGLDGLTDDQIAQAVYPEYQAYFPKYEDFYARVKSGDSAFGKQLESGWEGYKSGMGRVAGIVSDTADQWADKKQQASEAAALRARQLGIPQTWDEVSGPVDTAKYVGKLAADSLPYVGEAIAGSITGGASLTGTLARQGLRRAATRGPLSLAEQAAVKSAAGRTARGIGVVGGTYPSSVGDILGNQKDEAGETDVPAALALGVPYAAANLLGLEGTLGRVSALKPGIRAVDTMTGIKGRLARGAVAGTTQAVGESFNETFQEVMNQAGRVAVNPDAEMFGDEALARYKESAIGGALLGKTFGGTAGLLTGAKRELMPGAAQPAPATPVVPPSPPSSPQAAPPSGVSPVAPTAAPPGVPPASTAAFTGPAQPTPGVRTPEEAAADEKMRTNTGLFAKYGEPAEDVEEGVNIGIKFDGQTFKDGKALDAYLTKLAKAEKAKTADQHAVEAALQSAAIEAMGNPFTSKQITSWTNRVASTTQAGVAIRIKRALQEEVNKADKADQAKVGLLTEWHNQLTGKQEDIAALVTLPPQKVPKVSASVEAKPLLTRDEFAGLELEAQAQALVAEAIGSKNAERDAAVLIDVLRNEKSTDIAKKWGVSGSRVRQIAGAIQFPGFAARLQTAADRYGVDGKALIAQLMEARQAMEAAEGPGEAIAEDEADKRTSVKTAEERENKQEAEDATQEQALDKGATKQGEDGKTEGGMHEQRSANDSKEETGALTITELWMEAKEAGAEGVAAELADKVAQADAKRKAGVAVKDSINPKTAAAWRKKIKAEKEGTTDEGLQVTEAAKEPATEAKAADAADAAPAKESGPGPVTKKKAKRVVVPTEKPAAAVAEETTPPAEATKAVEAPEPPPVEYTEEALIEAWDAFQQQYAPTAPVWADLPEGGRKRWLEVAATGPSLRQMVAIAEQNPAVAAPAPVAEPAPAPQAEAAPEPTDNRRLNSMRDLKKIDTLNAKLPKGLLDRLVAGNELTDEEIHPLSFILRDLSYNKNIPPLVRRLIEEMSRFVMERDLLNYLPKFKIEEIDQAQAGEGQVIGGAYDWGERVITLDPRYATVLDLVHETAHWLTELSTDEDIPLGDTVKKTAHYELSRIYNDLRGMSLLPDGQKANLHKQYGLTSLKEFIAELFNPEFLEILAQIPATKRPYQTVPRFGTETEVQPLLANTDSIERQKNAFLAREIGKTMLGRVFYALRRIFSAIANRLQRRQSMTDFAKGTIGDTLHKNATGRLADPDLNIAEEALAFATILLNPDTIVFHTSAVTNLGNRKNPLRHITSEEEGREIGGLGDQWFDSGMYVAGMSGGTISRELQRLRNTYQGHMTPRLLYSDTVTQGFSADISLDELNTLMRLVKGDPTGAFQAYRTNAYRYFSQLRQALTDAYKNDEFKAFKQWILDGHRYTRDYVRAMEDMARTLMSIPGADGASHALWDRVRALHDMRTLNGAVSSSPDPTNEGVFLLPVSGLDTYPNMMNYDRRVRERAAAIGLGDYEFIKGDNSTWGASPDVIRKPGTDGFGIKVPFTPPKDVIVQTKGTESEWDRANPFLEAMYGRGVLTREYYEYLNKVINLQEALFANLARGLEQQIKDTVKPVRKSIERHMKRLSQNSAAPIYIMRVPNIAAFMDWYAEIKDQPLVADALQAAGYVESYELANDQGMSVGDVRYTLPDTVNVGFPELDGQPPIEIRLRKPSFTSLDKAIVTGEDVYHAYAEAHQVWLVYDKLRSNDERTTESFVNNYAENEQVWSVAARNRAENSPVYDGNKMAAVADWLRSISPSERADEFRRTVNATVRLGDNNTWGSLAYNTQRSVGAKAMTSRMLAVAGLAGGRHYDNYLSSIPAKGEPNQPTHNAAVLYDPEDKKRVKVVGKLYNIRTVAPTAQRRTLIERTVAKLPAGRIRDSAEVIAINIANFAKKGLFASAFTHDLVDLVKGTLPAAQEYLRIGGEWGVAKRELEIPVQEVLRLANTLDKDGVERVNTFVRDSRLKEAWGYIPKWHTGAIKVDPEMKSRWDALKPVEQEIVDKMFQHGDVTLARINKAIRNTVTGEYEERIKLAAKRGDDKEVAKLRTEQAEVLKESADQWKKIKGPYAPFRRHGDYVVVAKSQKYLDAKPADQEKLKSDAHEYFVAFFPTLGHAKVGSDKLQAMGRYASVVYSEKEFAGDDLGAPRWAVMQKLRGAALEDYEALGLDDAEKSELQKARKAVYKAVSDLYLTMVSETSARQAMRPLKKVAGFDEDMLRSFATHGAATAHYVASLEKSGEMREALLKMRDQAKKGTEDRAGRMRVYNELLKRFAAGLEHFPMDWQNKMLQFNSTWMLLTSPAYYVQNSLQPFMMTLPVLGGEFGEAKSFGALIDGYGEIKRLLETSKGLALLNLDAVQNSDERAMLKRLKDDNVLDIGIERELGEADYGQTGVGRAWQWANHKLTGAVRGVELVNRVSSALAAYRLAREKYMAAGETPEGAHAHAVNFARGILRQTHGDYSDFNAPRIMRQGAIKGLPIRLIMQFRKFQVIQLSLTARVLGKMIKDGTPEEKAVARAQLRWLLAHHTVMAGALGSPILSTLAYIMGSLFGDDGEDEEAMLRRVIDNKELSDLLLRGAPAWAGVNLSQRLGMGQMLTLLPYTDVSLDKGRAGYFETIGAALGPFLGGLLPRFADGVAAIGRGDVYKGWEMMLPSGFTNAARAYRELTQGVTTRAGDTVISADDMNLLDAAFRAAGFPTTKVTERGRIFAAVQKIEQHYDQEAAKIRLQYAKDGDLAAASQAWMQLQAERSQAGLKRQPLSTLIRAGRAQDKRERNTVAGVEYNRQNEALVRRLATQ